MTDLLLCHYPRPCEAPGISFRVHYRGNLSVITKPADLESMLDITIIMNSCIEEVLAFKCCNVFDQNLEIHIQNRGNAPVAARPELLLENRETRVSITHLYPPRNQRIEPGDRVAYYCTLDSDYFYTFTKLTVFDEHGRPFSKAIEKPAETVPSSTT